MYFIYTISRKHEADWTIRDGYFVFLNTISTMWSEISYFSDNSDFVQFPISVDDFGFRIFHRLHFSLLLIKAQAFNDQSSQKLSQILCKNILIDYFLFYYWKSTRNLEFYINNLSSKNFYNIKNNLIFSLCYKRLNFKNHLIP